MRIGIFGGTFNPPHVAHVSIAKRAIEQLDLDKLLVFPCGQPPHKFCSVPKNVRAELSRLAFSDLNKAELDEFELNKVGKSFTVETVAYVKDKYPLAELFLIVGGDSLRDLDKWREPRSLCADCTLVVAARPGSDLMSSAERARQNYSAKIKFLNVDEDDVSSTEIRLKRQFCFDFERYVPEKVAEYINQKNLYGDFRHLTQRLPQYLTGKRLSHTFYVTKKGLEIACDCSSNDVFVACALHDVAKYFSRERWSEYGFENADDAPEPVVHAFLGALVAKKDFGIENKAILDAIAYHTTARPNMTELDMVVYCADKLEETRPYPTVHLLKPTLEETFVATLREAYDACLKKGREVHPLTQLAINFYQNKITEEKL